MADNKTVKDGAGVDFVLALKDIASVFFGKWIKHNDAGAPDAYDVGVSGVTVPRVVHASDDPAVAALEIMDDWDSNDSAKVINGAKQYETVAASATDQVLGVTGAIGDHIGGVLIIPASTSPGAVTLTDNATAITIFAGGATSVSNLVPFFVPLGIDSVSGAWKLTTGANVSAIAVGRFT